MAEIIRREKLKQFSDKIEIKLSENLLDKKNI